MRVVVVEDQPFLRDLVSTGLSMHGVTVVGQAGDAVSAERAVTTHAPDLLLLDIRLPPTFTDEGVRIAEAVRRRHPEVAVMVLSSYAEMTFAERLIGMERPARAVGYLLKDRVAELARLVDDMRRVSRGEVVIDPAVLDRLVARDRGNGPALGRLTAHEQRILALVAEGRSNTGIAGELGCRVSTVERHLSVIIDKLGLPAAGDDIRPGVNVRVLATLAYLRGRNQRASM